MGSNHHKTRLVKFFLIYATVEKNEMVFVQLYESFVVLLPTKIQLKSTL